jgi:hypothetical protein
MNGIVIFQVRTESLNPVFTRRVIDYIISRVSIEDTLK